MLHRMLHVSFLALGALLVMTGLLLVTWIAEGSASPQVAAASAGSGVVAATASAPNDGRAILARVKQATGGARWDAVIGEHRVATLKAGGMQGRLELWIDARGCRFVERYELGPMKGAGAFDGARAWSQDSSGQSRLEEGGERSTANTNEAFRRCLAAWYPERMKASFALAGERDEGSRHFSVVVITPVGGRPYEVWVDAATNLIDREVEKTAADTLTVFYSDYREVDGLRVAFSIRQTNGETKYDQVVEATSVTFDEPVDATRFELPAPPPPDFAMAAGKTVTTVPFDLINNHIYVDVKLDGRGPYRLLCDTGGVNVVTPRLARELGLATEGALQGRGTGEKSEDLALAKVRTLEVGDARLNDQVFYIFDVGSLSDVEGAPVLGLIGYEVFKRFVVSIDYAHRTLRLTVPAAFSYQGQGAVVPFKFNEHVPQVEGTIDGIPGAFDLDTGARDSVTLLAPFAEKHGLASRYHATIEGITGWGLGGASRARVARAGLLTLGPVRVEKPVVELSLQKQGAFVDPYVAGNVGGGVLQRFTVTFDYARQQVIFEPNEQSRLPDVFDRAGMWINRDARGFEVKDVIAKGPAAEVGLAVGDHIVAVDGKPAAEVALPALRARLRTEPVGTAIELRVERKGGATRRVFLKLRDLV